MLYKARNGAIKFYDDYSLMASEAKYEIKGLRNYLPNNCFKDY